VGDSATLRLAITPPPAGEPVTVWAHESCFDGAREPAVEPDDPRNHGRVPSESRCAFCGDALPFIGKHPYVFDVGTAYPPQRFWAHIDCLHGAVGPEVVEQLKKAPPMKY
jgi:hypothetical protein